MRINKKKLLILLAIISFCIFNISSSMARAQGNAAKVATVEVKGNRAISTPTILSKIKTKPGSIFSQDIVNDDIKRLYALGYFTDVAVDVEDYEDGLKVTVLVEEKPVMKDVVFEGNKKIRSQRLLKLMKTKPGDMLKFGTLSDDIREIKSFYERNGFHQVNIKYELQTDKLDNQVVVKIIVDEKARIRIKKVYIEGNASVKTKKIRELMATRPAWIFSRGYFDEETFETDLARIKAYYQDLGFLDVVVTPQFDYTEEKGLMYITLRINENNQYLLKSITLKGDTVFPEEKVREKITSAIGQPFSHSKIRNDMEALREFYYHEGYMNAEIFVDRVIEPQTRDVDVIFEIKTKDIIYIGKIGITGNTKTKDIVIRRELRVFPGERFDGDKIRRSKERLYNLGFFEDIYFETEQTDEPDVNNLAIGVKEAKTGEFSFGGGYSSVDQFIGFVQIMQKNFDLFNFPYFTGDGQNLVVSAQVGTARRDFNISWTEPWILDYPLSFGFDAYHRTHLRTTNVGYGYQEVRSGGDIRFGKEFMEYFRGSLMYRLENVNISDVSDEATDDLKREEGDKWLSSLIFGISYDNRDNVFSPTKGFITSATLENTGGPLMGDKDFIKGYFSNAFYYSPLRKIVIEFRTRVGLVESYDNTEQVPIYERFYAGGANTIRGYRERKVGPRDPASNDPIGGEAQLIGNIELSFPMYEKIIKGAVFYDVGNVWREIGDFAQGGYKHGAGVGVRVKTPIGPIKIDWGYPLSENHDDEKVGQFYFSVSHGF